MIVPELELELLESAMLVAVTPLCPVFAADKIPDVDIPCAPSCKLL